MSDTEARAALREWESGEGSVTGAVLAYRHAGLDLPWNLLAATPQWSRVVSFVSKWFDRGLEPADGLPWDRIAEAEASAGIGLPLALREWFALLGGRPGLLMGMAEPVSLSRLRIHDGQLTFCRGHQGIGEWLIRAEDLHLDDPVVYLDLDIGNLKQEGQLTDYLLSLLLYQVGFVYTPPEGLGTFVQRRIRWDQAACMAIVRAHYARVPLPSLHQGTYGDGDTIIHDDGFELVSFAGRSDEAWAKLERLLGRDGWEADDYRRAAVG